MAGSSKAETRRPAWVALLRGINLGARNKVSMPDLRALMAGVGAEDVTTYVQSGYGRSKLSNAFFEKQFGVPATTRNWRTATNLAELARA
jgi:uncharacterized protein (DUF1697 family)